MTRLMGQSTVSAICVLLFVAGVAAAISGFRAEYASTGSGLLMIVYSMIILTVAGIGMALAYKMLNLSDPLSMRTFYGILYAVVTLAGIGIAVDVARRLVG